MTSLRKATGSLFDGLRSSRPVRLAVVSRQRSAKGSPRDIRFAALVLAVLALVVLEGCGFRLRGSGGELERVPPIYVRGGDPAALELRQFLRTGGVDVVDRVAQARLVLDVEDSVRERRVLSVGSRGRVQEYELVYRLGYRIEDRDGDAVLAQQTVVERRDFSFDETDVVAKSNEEDFLFRDMQRSAVMQIMRGLQVIDFPDPDGEPAPDAGATGGEGAGTGAAGDGAADAEAPGVEAPGEEAAGGAAR